MTIAIPFDRSSRTKNPSIVLDQDLLDAIDRARVAEDDQEPMSRSAMIRTMLYFALSLMTDPKAQAEFALEHAHLIPKVDGTRLRRST
ncbi:hypothetical protein SR39_31405 [Methylobacterium radiotolerans]|jgi:hypothetical protein|nr:hypothetical protein SR39_31405 [Methylobacterium radiotolerans]